MNVNSWSRFPNTIVFYNLIIILFIIFILNPIFRISSSGMVKKSEFVYDASVVRVKFGFSCKALPSSGEPTEKGLSGKIYSSGCNGLRA